MDVDMAYVPIDDLHGLERVMLHTRTQTVGVRVHVADANDNHPVDVTDGRTDSPYGGDCGIVG